jgi:23S rRNA pseudouridine1911/1915/1917 synthase
VPQPSPNPRIRLEIVHEDPRIVVANKAPGLVTEPGKSHGGDSLLNALVARFGGKLLQLGERRDHGLLHRLDRQTSGCVACALDPEAYDHVRAQFEARSVEKTYLAILKGRMRAGRQTIDRNLEERRVPSSEGTRLVSVVAKEGKPARTDVEVLATSTTHTLVACRPHSGRLHQIRVHMAHLGFPVAGDPLYAAGARICPTGKSDDRTLGLHAWRLSFDHPSGGRVDAVAPPSRRFLELARETGISHGSLSGSP